MQIMQSRVLPFGDYKASIWLRSSGSMPVLVSLDDDGVQLLSKVMVTPSWKRVELNGWVTSWDRAAFIVSANRPGTLWAADADLHRTSDWMFETLLALLMLTVGAAIVIPRMKRWLRELEKGSVTVRIGNTDSTQSVVKEK